MRGPDSWKCGQCGGSLIPGVTAAGYGSGYCVRCGTEDVVIPERVPAGHRRAIGDDVEDRCICCGARMVTGRFAGAVHPTACAHHTPEEIDRARVRLPDGRIKCSTPGCTRPARSRGKCVPCYSKWWRKVTKVVGGHAVHLVRHSQ